MSTKVVVQAEPLVHGDITAPNLGLVLKLLAAGEAYSVTATVNRALRAAGLSAVNVYYRKTAISTVSLKFSVTHIDTGTVPSTPTVVTDAAYTTETLAGTTGQVNYFAIPTTLTSFSSIDENDFVGLGILRNSTDTGDFEIVRVEFEFNKDADESATVQLYDIVTLGEVKDFLQLTSTTHDIFLQKWISYHSLEMEGINGINNKIKVQDVSNEILNGTGRSKIRPKYYPIYAIGIATSTTDALKLASVQYRDDTDSAWTNIEDDIDHILINNPELSVVSEQDSYNLELTEDTFPEGTANIRLSYQAGWSTIPGELKLVCLEKVAETFRNSNKSDGGRFGVQSITIGEGGGTRTMTFKDLYARHQMMMKPYKRKL